MTVDVDLPEPSRWARVIGDNSEDCWAPQWVFPGGTITAYSDGVTVGEDFREDLPALRALTLATLAAIEHAERQATGRVDREDVTLT